MPIIQRRRQQQRHDFYRVLVVLPLLLILIDLPEASLAFSIAVAVVGGRRYGGLLYHHHPATTTTTPHHNLHRHQHCHLQHLLSSLLGSVNDNNNDDDDDKEVTGITLKIAVDSVTGGVADLAPKDNMSDRFTCPAALDMVHRLRRDCDAVLVGRGTVVADNPSLTVRRGFDCQNDEKEESSSRKSDLVHPLRVILDPGLSLLLDRFNEGRLYQVFQDGLPTVVYHCVRDVDEDSLNLLPSVMLVQLSPNQVNTLNKPRFCADIASGELRPPPSSTKELTATTTEAVTTKVVEEVVPPPMTSMQMSVQQVWSDLSQRFDVKHLMVEGGPTTARAFLEAGLVDRVILVQANVGFQKPYLAKCMSNETFLEAGLVLQGTDTLGVDQVEYWTRPNTPWPSAKLNEWP
jgi:riboflavin biosynthesis pyrimidine reductase